MLRIVSGHAVIFYVSNIDFTGLYIDLFLLI